MDVLAYIAEAFSIALSPMGILALILSVFVILKTQYIGETMQGFSLSYNAIEPKFILDGL